MRAMAVGGDGRRGRRCRRRAAAASPAAAGQSVSALAVAADGEAARGGPGDARERAAERAGGEDRQLVARGGRVGPEQLERPADARPRPPTASTSYDRRPRPRSPSAAGRRRPAANAPATLRVPGEAPGSIVPPLFVTPAHGPAALQDAAVEDDELVERRARTARWSAPRLCVSVPYVPVGTSLPKRPAATVIVPAFSSDPEPRNGVAAGLVDRRRVFVEQRPGRRGCRPMTLIVPRVLPRCRRSGRPPPSSHVVVPVVRIAAPSMRDVWSPDWISSGPSNAVRPPPRCVPSRSESPVACSSPLPKRPPVPRTKCSSSLPTVAFVLSSKRRRPKSADARPGVKVAPESTPDRAARRQRGRTSRERARPRSPRSPCRATKVESGPGPQREASRSPTPRSRRRWAASRAPGRSR